MPGRLAKITATDDRRGDWRGLKIRVAAFCGDDDLCEVAGSGARCGSRRLCDRGSRTKISVTAQKRPERHSTKIWNFMDSPFGVAGAL